MRKSTSARFQLRSVALVLASRFRCTGAGPRSACRAPTSGRRITSPMGALTTPPSRTRSQCSSGSAPRIAVLAARIKFVAARDVRVVVLAAGAGPDGGGRGLKSPAFGGVLF
jgi:hypothetical protein